MGDKQLTVKNGYWENQKLDGSYMLYQFPHYLGTASELFEPMSKTFGIE